MMKEIILEKSGFKNLAHTLMIYLIFLTVYFIISYNFDIQLNFLGSVLTGVTGGFLSSFIYRKYLHYKTKKLIKKVDKEMEFLISLSLCKNLRYSINKTQKEEIKKLYEAYKEIKNKDPYG